MNKMTDDEDVLVEMQLCPKCHHQVPAMNMGIHEAMSCGHHHSHSQHFDTADNIHDDDEMNYLQPSSSTNNDDNNMSVMNQSANLYATESDIPQGSATQLNHVQNDHNPISFASTRIYNNDSHDDDSYNNDYENMDTSRDISTTNLKREEEDENSPYPSIGFKSDHTTPDIVDLVNDQSDDDTSIINAEWSCPRCTLINPI